MSLRKLEATVPAVKRQTVLDALTKDGGLGHETHVGEFIVCTACENCVVISVVCSSARAGELMNALTSKGIGVQYGTLTSVNVASQRPNPIALANEFKDLKAKIEGRARVDFKDDHEFTRRWKRRQNRLERRKINNVSSTAAKSVEELYNEVLGMAVDGSHFYISVMCASVIAGVGLLTNSSVVVLSAMLISPLMGPILSSAFALAIGDWVLFWASVFAEIRAAIVTFLVGSLVGIIYGPYAVSYGENQIPTAEMSGRGQLHGLLGGLIIAVASGVVVAMSITSDGVNSLVGVAISASLLPPIVNSGTMIVFATGISNACDDASSMKCTMTSQKFLEKAGISFALYVTNVVTIILVASFIFYNQKIGLFKGFVVNLSTELLNVGNKHVRDKLHVATAIKGAIGERTFDKLLDDATAGTMAERPTISQSEKKAPVDTVDVEAPEPGEAAEVEEYCVPDEDFMSEFSVLRPFPEPQGVQRPAFAAYEEGDHVFGWVKRIREMITY
ncbi:Protein of unknown function DUF389 [Ostreococcus tauri]|uniref:DUF389 domain-containing protein n=1 Tax=Ostreococcus tauri TaxID=70448 RepID=Q018Y6_OSTTA|nr:Protein of unknown function DUF389 [Ostreococcus tauri]CAL54039.1 Protein of unknown function DUF389 [Ostreococcus tauri]|eukprot:XP_003079381.1 Protein of unknown function DUF389 [Ostreococcus tauri]